MSSPLTPSHRLLSVLVQQVQIVTQRYGPHLLADTPLRRLLAEPGPLRDWLAAQPPEQVVGAAGSGGTCPLARFLEAQGCDSVWVTLERTTATLDGQGYATLHPAWLISFLLEVDGQGKETSITAQDALTIIEAVSIQHSAVSPVSHADR